VEEYLKWVVKKEEADVLGKTAEENIRARESCKGMEKIT
jgi:hypothetical protein